MKIRNRIFKYRHRLVRIGLAAMMALSLMTVVPSETIAAPGGSAAGHPGKKCAVDQDNLPNEGVHAFSFDGQERAYRLDLPKKLGKKPSPMILNFHGGGGNKESMEAYTHMGEEGSSRGYIVVTPDALGTPTGWNLFGDPARANDYGFVDALISDLSDRLCVDENRVFAAGHSNGSAFTGLLACKSPYRFSAVAMVAAFVPPNYANCPVEQATPSVVAFHGTEDPGIPYEGGWVSGITLEGEFFVPGVLDTLDAYADAYDCKQPVKESSPAPNVIHHRFNKCIHDSRAALYSIIGGGHEWPGTASAPEDRHKRFHATDAILDFFGQAKK